MNNRERFYIFIVIILISSAKIAIGTSKSWISRGFSFTSWGLTGPPGYFQNSGELAILMLTLFPVAYYLYVYLKPRIEKWEKVILIIFWVSPVLTILGTSSRGGQLALALQLLIMFYKKIFRIKQLVVIATLLYMVYNLLPDEQKARFESVGEDKTSIQRFLYWKHGIEMINESPLLGVGYFNFPAYYGEYYARDLLYPEAELPHNIFVQVGADAGYPGLILFILMLFRSIYIARKKSEFHHPSECDYLLIGFSLSLLGFVIAGQFVSVAYYPFLWVYMALVVACDSIMIKRSSLQKSKIS